VCLLLCCSLPCVYTGRVFAVGSNDNAQLADGTQEPRDVSGEVVFALDAAVNSKSLIPLGSIIKQVAASSGDNWANQDGYTLFLTEQGRVLASGGGPSSDAQFDLIDPINVMQRVPVYVDNLGDDIKAIAAGRSHSLFLRNDGVALAVGFNLWGQLGHDNYNGNYATTPYIVPIADTDPDTTLDTEIVHIDANQDGFHSLFITGSGRALGAGRNDNGQLGINSIVK